MNIDFENVKPIDEMSEWERTKAIGSARYILEDVSAEEISKASGLPVGVITAAFANIFVSKDAVED
ncbi:MAG: hypothetical protein ACOVMR_10415 [Flavobacteriales bacterium]